MSDFELLMKLLVFNIHNRNPILVKECIKFTVEATIQYWKLFKLKNKIYKTLQQNVVYLV